MSRRIIDLVVISDIHLGTFGCHASELVDYLRTIQPKMLVLNGDIVDIWQFNKRYFPKSHMQVIKEIFSLLGLGTQVVYITGNHDEIMRRYSDISIGQLQLTDKLVLELNGKKTWIFHGDVFDRTTRGSAKIIAKLGGYGYDLLILINRFINHILHLFGREKMSLSKKVKNGVKQAVSWIGNFEQTAAELAIENGYEFVICGHIHQPQQRVIKTDKGSVIYLNSGDWIENLTALEYHNDCWTIYHHDEQSNRITTPVIKMQKQLSIEDLLATQLIVTANTK
ncbi:MAG: UDP-2,3-diacylglucosamine diphosphatase [Sediminibacterium sp.]|nr:UDP-2,3-diacylglucosamine diphosphatase [Sediminibacterium sp.]